MKRYDLHKRWISYLYFTVNCLIRFGKPNYFYKKKFVKDCKIKSVSEFVQQFNGINNSKLIVLGTIDAEMTLNGVTKSNVTLIIVPDNTMQSNIVLERDTLKIFEVMFSNASMSSAAFLKRCNLAWSRSLESGIPSMI